MLKTTIEPVVITVKDKLQVKKAETFSQCFSSALEENLSFTSVVKAIDERIKNDHPSIDSSALSNSHGDWYEWFIAFTAWNYRIETNSKYLLLILPNKRQFDVSTLYQTKLSEYISDLKSKVSSSSNVELISSNPDFVIIDTSDLELPSEFNEKINKISTNTIDMLNLAYKKFIGKCSLNNIHGYLSVKTSFRPDRRLQIAHEGSLMKAIYVHLQTRDWIINPKGLKYFAASTSVGQPDYEALRTVATHSITNVSSKPQAAVDKVFMINDVESATAALSVIFS